jgi:hypothetical protein
MLYYTMAKSRQSRSNRKQHSQKRGGGYMVRGGSSLSGSPVQRGGSSLNTAAPARRNSFLNSLQNGGKRSAKRSRSKSSRKQRKSRKQKGSRKSESFVSTLNQMGGFVRDGTTQFFRILQGQE